jgi:hypothetical protein
LACAETPIKTKEAKRMRKCMFAAPLGWIASRYFCSA